MFDFKEELKKVPEKPGCYLMHDESGKIIYVGKAKILRNRMRSYFNNTPHNERITQMISRINWFEFIVTDSEYESLLLECNLIKKHRPKYNVLLKDDKNYPYIKVTTNEPFPRCFMAHKKVKDGSSYFGPYYLSYTVKSTLDTFQRVFKLRTCKKTINQGRPQRVCLNYHIGLCEGPCAGYISETDYAKNVQAICDFLSGKTSLVLERLSKEMLIASEELDFEKAADIRDRIKSLEIVSEKQKIMLDNSESMDVIAASQNETDSVVEIFHVVNGQISGRDYFVFEGAGDSELSEIYTSFLSQYYETEMQIPRRIFVADNLELEEVELQIKMLSDISGHSVKIETPMRGNKKKICEMARENAIIALKNYEITKKNENGGNLVVLEKIKALCNLDRLPLRIESFDISNLGDNEIDGSMVVFVKGKAEKNEYKHYKIKTLDSRSDVGSMNEMLTRRYTRLVNEDKGFEKKPDVIFMDGGITQIHEAIKVLGNLGLDIPVFGMVKDDKHRSRGLLSPSGEEFRLNEDNDIWRFVTSIQDETHRFAITYNRKLTEKRYKKSPLDDISGIGDKRKVALLRRFGSVKGIREADVADIAEVEKIGMKLALKIKQGLNKEG